MSRECTLLDVPCGEKARIRSLTGCGCERSRLCALGFTPGTEVEISRCGSGRRVRIRDTCVLLDADLAGTILCDGQDDEDSLLPGQECPEPRDAACASAGKARE